MFITNTDIIKSILGLLLFTNFSCNPPQNNDYIPSELTKHDIEIDNRKISFLVPKGYSTEYKVPRFLMYDYDSGEDTILLYNTPENSFNFFEVRISIDTNLFSQKDFDAFMHRGKLIGNSRDYAVTWSYTKTISNIPVWYIVNIFREPSIEYIEHKSCTFSDTICSIITCIMNFDTIVYQFTWETKEHINNFSYEEKRKIMEAIRVW